MPKSNDIQKQDAQNQPKIAQNQSKIAQIEPKIYQYQLTPPAMTTVLPILAQAWPHLKIKITPKKIKKITLPDHLSSSFNHSIRLIKPVSVQTVPLLKIPSGWIVLSDPGSTKQAVGVAADQQELLLVLADVDAAHLVSSFMIMVTTSRIILSSSSWSWSKTAGYCIFHVYPIVRCLLSTK